MNQNTWMLLFLNLDCFGCGVRDIITNQTIVEEIIVNDKNAHIHKSVFT